MLSQPPEKANEDGLVFPWKQKEILTFDIPVYDTEKAGLGKIVIQIYFMIIDLDESDVLKQYWLIVPFFSLQYSGRFTARLQ